MAKWSPIRWGVGNPLAPFNGARFNGAGLVLLLAVFGCLGACDRDAGKESLARKSAQLKSAAAANAKAAAPIAPRTIQVGQHEMLVVDVPSVEFGAFISTQRCYVWRDTEFRVASMSCPHEASPLSSDDSASDIDDRR